MNSKELDATRVPTEIEIAWAAGIYEGEGSCIKGGKNGTSFSVQVAQKDPELLYRMRDLFGGRIKLYNTGEERRFPIFYWQLCGDRARLFAALVYPFLTSRRKSQIDATRIRLFLDCSEDLLDIAIANRFELISKRLEKFVSDRKVESILKRKEYLKAYYQTCEYKENHRIKVAKRRKNKKEKLQARPPNIVTIAS